MNESGLVLEVVHDLDRLVLLREEWNHLLAGSAGDSVYLTHEWMTTWWRHCGGTGDLFVVLVRDGGHLIGIAPLMIVRDHWRGVPARYLRFVSFPLADRTDFILSRRRAACVEALIDLFLRESRRWDILHLTEILETSETLGCLEDSCRRRNLLLTKRLSSRPPFIRLDRDWDVIQAGFSGKFRRRLRVDRARLVKRGQVRFERVVPRTGEVEALIRLLAQVERRSWKGKWGVGFLTRAGQVDFALEVSQALAVRGSLDVALLWLDERLIAYRFGFRYDHKFWDYNVAYDPAYEDLAPGHVLLGWLIEDSCRIGLREVDASRATLKGHVLEQWTREARCQYDVSIFNSSLYSRALGFVDARIKPVFRRFLRRPGSV